MSRSADRAMDTPDVLQKLGRPGFPQGLKVLLVGNGQRDESREIEEQMKKLFYTVTCCESCSEARLQLASSTNAMFDIVLAEAGVVSKDTQEGAFLLEAISGLPLVLLSPSESMTECVWRGIEIGAAEVLEKPLSTHKLQNIWQHVVRRALGGKESCLFSTSPSDNSSARDKGDHQSLRSGKTRSSNMSTQDEKIYLDVDGSFSGSPEASVDASMSNTSPSESYTVESTANDTQAKMDWSPSRAMKRSHETNAGSSQAFQKRKAPKATLRSTHSQPLANQARQAHTVVGMVHPSWTNSQANSQAFRGSIPPGCVWGTPLNPPPGWQASQANASKPGPLLGSAATNSSLPRYNSAPVCKLEPLSASLDGFDPLGDLDSAFNLGDEFLLGADCLDCEDSFFSSLTDGTLGLSTICAPDYGLEAPPIGLALKKSESLLDLINAHLSQPRIQTMG